MEETNIKELFNYFNKKKYILLISTLIIAVLSFLYEYYIKVPQYKSDTSIILISDQTETKITSSDIQLNQSLVSTYSEIIKSRKILEEVIDDLDLPYTYEELFNNISINSGDNTSIITISVIDKNINYSYKIANKIAEVFVKTVVELYDISNVHILDLAVKAKKAYNINYVKDILIISILGFALTTFVLFIIYIFDNSISSIEQIEKLKLPVLGKIHYKKDLNDRYDSNLRNTISEDIRTIKTNMDFSLLDEKDKVILFTSSIPSEGKSFVSSKLAMNLTQNKKKVLIIDCDMRLGRVNKIFTVSNKFGLSNLLSKYKNKTDIESSIQKTNVKDLDVISRGIVPPNPPELLSGNRFSRVLNELKNRYDYIILDTPPVVGISDTVILSKLVDKIIIVCSVGTKEEELKETKNLLSHEENKIIGVILNKVNNKRREKYGYNGYYNMSNIQKEETE